MGQDILLNHRLISIICPVLNEEQAIPIFYDRLKTALSSVKDRYNFELIFVNNRSTDKTLEIILSLRKRDSSIKVITLSRNFGYQASVQAGMSCAIGEGVIVIDADCEDPPELIPQFIAKWEEGYDVVYGIRRGRPEPWITRKIRDLFYHILRFSADADIVLYMAEFALISSHVRDALLSNKNTFPFLRSEIGYAGFSRFGIAYDRQQRVTGKTHYNIFSMFSFAVAGILTSSTFLLRIAAYMFPLFAFLNIMILITDIFFKRLGLLKSLIVIDFIYITFLLTVHGLYIARIYKNGIGRPIFIIDPKHSYITTDDFFQKK